VMAKTKKRSLKIAGLAGALACLVIFVKDPSFPTPDKLIVFLFFIFLFRGQATEMLKRLGPFVALTLIYESFRSIVPRLNDHVHYLVAPQADRLLFGSLPTQTLQRWLWRGHTSWYDVVLYLPYLLFFIIPLALAILVWKTRDKYYWQVVWTYLVVFFGAFLTFLIYPAAPPWLAAQNHYIGPITRISSNVWATLGIHNFPSIYNHLAANPVAAIPSLHAATAVLLTIFIFKLYGRGWGLLSVVYPLLLCIGIVYEGEHYVFDVICGILYAFAGYFITPALIRFVKRLSRVTPLRKSVLRSS
jgi:membrane-associated phospholipid phosphatase